MLFCEAERHNVRMYVRDIIHHLRTKLEFLCYVMYTVVHRSHLERRKHKVKEKVTFQLKGTKVWEIENWQWPHRTGKLNFLDLKASKIH